MRLSATGVMPTTGATGTTQVTSASVTRGDSDLESSTTTSLVFLNTGMAGELCPSRPFWMVCDQDSSVRFPASCNSFRCSLCGPREVPARIGGVAWAASIASSRWFFTLTHAPEDWSRCRKQVNDLGRRIRSAGYTWEVAWAREQGAETGMWHVAGLQHGDALPEAELRRLWGGRRVDIRRVGPPGDGPCAIEDVLPAARYVMKGAGNDLVEHLDLNGGRIVRTSRGYMHGRQTPEAVKEARHALWPSKPARTYHAQLPRVMPAQAPGLS